MEFITLLENSFYTNKQELDDLKSKKKRFISAFWMSFLGTIGIYIIEKDNFPSAKQYFKNEGKLRIDNIDENNNDVSVLLPELKNVIPNALMEKLTRFLVRLKFGQDVDENIFKSDIVKPLHDKIKLYTKSLPIIESAVLNYIDGKEQLEDIITKFIPIAKRQKVCNEFIVLARKCKFAGHAPKPYRQGIFQQTVNVSQPPATIPTDGQSKIGSTTITTQTVKVGGYPVKPVIKQKTNKEIAIEYITDYLSKSKATILIDHIIKTFSQKLTNDNIAFLNKVTTGQINGATIVKEILLFVTNNFADFDVSKIKTVKDDLIVKITDNGWTFEHFLFYNSISYILGLNYSKHFLVNLLQYIILFTDKNSLDDAKIKGLISKLFLELNDGDYLSTIFSRPVFFEMFTDNIIDFMVRCKPGNTSDIIDFQSMIKTNKYPYVNTYFTQNWSNDKIKKIAERFDVSSTLEPVTKSDAKFDFKQLLPINTDIFPHELGSHRLFAYGVDKLASEYIQLLKTYMEEVLKYDKNSDFKEIIKQSILSSDNIFLNLNRPLDNTYFRRYLTFYNKFFEYFGDRSLTAHIIDKMYKISFNDENFELLKISLKNCNNIAITKDEENKLVNLLLGVYGRYNDVLSFDYKRYIGYYKKSFIIDLDIKKTLLSIYDSDSDSYNVYKGSYNLKSSVVRMATRLKIINAPISFMNSLSKAISDIILEKIDGNEKQAEFFDEFLGFNSYPEYESTFFGILNNWSDTINSIEDFVEKVIVSGTIYNQVQRCAILSLVNDKFKNFVNEYLRNTRQLLENSSLDTRHIDKYESHAKNINEKIINVYISRLRDNIITDIPDDIKEMLKDTMSTNDSFISFINSSSNITGILGQLNKILNKILSTDGNYISDKINNIFSDVNQQILNDKSGYTTKLESDFYSQNLSIENKRSVISLFDRYMISKTIFDNVDNIALESYVTAYNNIFVNNPNLSKKFDLYHGKYTKNQFKNLLSDKISILYSNEDFKLIDRLTINFEKKDQNDLLRRVRSNGLMSTMIKDSVKTDLIPVGKNLSEAEIISAFKYNNFNIDAVTKLRKKPKESIGEYLKRFKDFVKQNNITLPDQKVKKVDRTKEELIRYTYEINTKYRAGKHGAIGCQFVEEFDVQLDMTKWEDFRKQYPDKKLYPAFHGTNSVAAAMVTRFGFTVLSEKQLKDAGGKFAGQMLGPGIYTAPKIDKVSNYIGNSNYGSLGSVGYLFLMDETLGIKGTHYREAGTGGDNIRSAEYCAKYPRQQLKIVKCFKAVKSSVKRIISDAESIGIKVNRKLLESVKNDSGVFLEGQGEFNTPGENIYTFMDFFVPINNNEIVSIEDLDITDKNIEVAQNQQGLELRIKNKTGEFNHYVIYNAGEFRDEGGQEFDKFLSYIKDKVKVIE